MLQYRHSTDIITKVKFAFTTKKQVLHFDFHAFSKQTNHRIFKSILFAMK